MRAPLACLVLALAASCGHKTTINYVRRAQGVDGAWEAAQDEHKTTLDATGATATLEFMGRTFVFEDMPEFHGYIAPDKVELTSRTTRIWVTAEGFWAEGPFGRYKQKMETIPAGTRVFYERGRLRLG